MFIPVVFGSQVFSVILTAVSISPFAAVEEECCSLLSVIVTVVSVSPFAAVEDRLFLFVMCYSNSCIYLTFCCS